MHELGFILKPFQLTIKADYCMSAAQKYGLGSSAAVTVAVIKAICLWAGMTVDLETIFKLASIAHLRAQQWRGSCFDIAAATYQSTLAYRSFDKDWLCNQIASSNSLSSIINASWPLLAITMHPLPASWQLCIGWTLQSSSTTQLLEGMEAHKQKHPHTFTAIMTDINEIVVLLIDAIKTNNYLELKQLIAQNRYLLSCLADQSQIVFETEQLTKLIEIANSCGAAAKLSGAGGGDCGIALCCDFNIAQKVHDSWLNNNIKPLPVHPLI